MYSGICLFCLRNRGNSPTLTTGCGGGHIPYILIEGNTGNNIVSNLEWCTNDENQKHAARMRKENERN